MNEGRTIFPSTLTESLVEKMRLSKSRPITTHMQNEVIKSVGDVAISNPNQPVEGGITFTNLQVNGPTRHQTVVHQKPKILMKHENKRLDGQVTEALYDWRSQESKSGYAYNHLQNQLSDRAKNKVFNQPMYNYMLQPNRVDSNDQGTAKGIPVPVEFENVQVAGMNQNFEGFKPENTSSFQNNFEEGTMKLNSTAETGGMGFGALMQQQLRTNPLLHGNFTGSSMVTGLQQHPQGNSPYRTQYDSSVNFATAHPDERMTHYSGERPYTTFGDRQLAARQLATSKANQEMRQLQEAAYQAGSNIARAPRRNVPNMSQGVNDDYQDVTVISGTESQKYDVDKAGRRAQHESDKEGTIKEKYIARDTLVNRSVLATPQYGESAKVGLREGVINPMYPQGSINNRGDKVDQLTMVQPQSRVQTQKVMDEVQRHVYENDLERKIYEDDGPKLFNKSQLESFKDSVDDRSKFNLSKLFENFLNTKSKQEIDKRDHFTVNKLFEGFKSFFGISTKRREDYETRKQTDDEYYYDENLKQIIPKQIGTTRGNDAIMKMEKEAKTAYWVVENGRIRNVVNDFKDPTSIKQRVTETKPRGILLTDKDLQTISLIKNGDRIKILQKIEDQEGTRYVTINIDKVTFEKLMDHPVRVLREMKNIKDANVCELTYEEFLLVKKLIDQTPGVMKLISNTPLTEYHRELLDKSTEEIPFFTNSHKVAELNVMQKEFVDRRAQEGSTQRIDTNVQQQDRMKFNPIGERFYQSEFNNGQVNNGTGIRDQTAPTAQSISKNNTKLMKKFNSMM